jgi:hypothetical protein
MGMLQDMKDKAKDMVTDNKDKIATGIDKAGDMIDKKTGHKHSDKIDDVQHTVAGKLDDVTGGDIGANEPATPAPSQPTAATSVPDAATSAVSPSLVPNPSPEAAAEGTRSRPTPRAH